MTARTIARSGRGLALLLLALLVSTPFVSAQSAVGSGPLTGTLADIEPTSGVLSIGRVKLAPGIVVREIGWDSNVFDQPEDEGPKEDYVASAVPDVSLFSRLRFVKLSAYGGAELTYYQKYESERSTGYMARGRIDILLSRLRPFVGGGRTKTRTRPNGEIDVRANRTEEELSGGVAFDLGPTSLVYGSAVRTRTSYQDAIQENVNLGQSLSRDGDEYSAGLKTDLTPLTSLILYGAFHQDRFPDDPSRDAEVRSANATFTIAPEAVVTGVINVAYRDFKAVDALVKPYRGLTGSAAIVYPILEVGRLYLVASRSQDYSFNAAQAYFLKNSIALSYNHRLVGAVDAQLAGGRSVFDYGARDDAAPYKDTHDTAEIGVGYNLRNRTRVSLNYEYARRRSPVFPARNYDRRRVFIAWAYAF